MDITLNGVCKSFGTKQVLNGFSAVLPGGGATAFMGPSGSGKTTLGRILMGLEKPDAGQVEGAKDQRFCPVFQEDRLCDGQSAADNVALVLPRQARGDVVPALAEVGLGEAELTKPVALLSGGERRRVALVRAVLAPGQVLLLDEAFKGLDEDTRALAMEFIRRRLSGRTLLLITHERAEAKVFGARVVQVALT